MKFRHLLITALIVLFAVGITVPTGCAFRAADPAGANQPAHLDPVVLGKDVRTVTRSAARLAIQAEPKARQYVQIAFSTLDTFIHDQNYNPDSLKAALLAIPVNELHDPTIVAGITDAVEILQNHFGELVNKKLSDGTPYLVPVLTGFRDGLGDALGSPTSSVEVHGSIVVVSGVGINQGTINQ